MTIKHLSWIMLLVLTTILAVHFGFMPFMSEPGQCHVAGGQDATCVVAATLQEAALEVMIFVAIIVFVAGWSAKVFDTASLRFAVLARTPARHDWRLHIPIVRALARGILQRRTGDDRRSACLYGNLGALI